MRYALLIHYPQPAVSTLTEDEIGAGMAAFQSYARALDDAGVTDALGSVDAGDTQTDTLALERRRGITIKSAVVAFAIVRAQVVRATQAQRAVGPMTAVARAAHDLAAGDVLGPGDVRLDEMPAVFAPPGALGSADQHAKVLIDPTSEVATL